VGGNWSKGADRDAPRVLVWDVAAGRRIAAIGGHSAEVDAEGGHGRRIIGAVVGSHAACLSPDGKTLAIAHPDGTVGLWDVASRRTTACLKGHSGQVFCVSFSPNGRVLASSAADSTIRLWDATSWNCTKVLIGDTMPAANPIRGVYSVRFSPDGKTLASCGFDGSLAIWDAATGEKLVSFDRPKTGVCKTHPSVVFSVAFHPDGKVLAAVTEQGRCEIWDIVAKKSTQVISDARFWVRSIAFSPDGMLLAVGDERGPARLYVRMPSTGRTR